MKAQTPWFRVDLAGTRTNILVKFAGLSEVASASENRSIIWIARCREAPARQHATGVRPKAKVALEAIRSARTMSDLPNSVLLLGRRRSPGMVAPMYECVSSVHSKLEGKPAAASVRGRTPDKVYAKREMMAQLAAWRLPDPP